MKPTPEPAGPDRESVWAYPRPAVAQAIDARIVIEHRGGSSPTPTPPLASLRDHIAIYAAPLDRCSVEGETVGPQPGAFYGSWITSKVVGPFKGVPGSQGW